jgi:hypothetical protein
MTIYFYVHKSSRMIKVISGIDESHLETFYAKVE